MGSVVFRINLSIFLLKSGAAGYNYPMQKLIFRCLAISFFFYLSSCSNQPRDYEIPTVDVYSFKALPTTGLAPEFEIGLRIINPNRTPLELTGLSYSIYIEGHKLITGVSNTLPVIGPYGQDKVTLLATTNLFSSLSLLADLLKQPRDAFGYRFEAKLDQGGVNSDIHVVKKGEVKLR